MDLPTPPATSPALCRLAVLYVDDEEGNLELFRLHFEDDFDVRTARSGAEALDLMQHGNIGLLLTDEKMPGMSGIELLTRVYERWPETVRIVVSAYTAPELLLRAMNRAHAYEYVVKPWDESAMRAYITRGLEHALRMRKLTADAAIGEATVADDPEALIAACSGLRDVLSAVRKASRSSATILIRGETGTGKELIARLIHNMSPRTFEPFVPVHCAQFNDGVIESELFGHEKGSFSGAQQTRRARFETANRGTIFFDEIGDVPSNVQVKLLRVLQERQIERVGGSEHIPIDVRIIAATHCNLEELVKTGAFREDLFFRLNVVPIAIPPLRERPVDISPLLDYFIAKYSRNLRRTVSEEAREVLLRYGWPGNVRELENVVQRAVILSDHDELQLEDFCLTFPVGSAPGSPSGPGRSIKEQVRDTEKEQLRDLLIKHGGNKARAARELGVPRSTLVSRLKKHDLT